MEKGYYRLRKKVLFLNLVLSQSTIKMEKGYYSTSFTLPKTEIKLGVAIHNKNGKGLLPFDVPHFAAVNDDVAIHNKNGKGLLLKIA